MRSAKQELLELLEQMPDDAPMDTLLAAMHFKARVLRGVQEFERGEAVSHEEVKKLLEE